MEGNHGRDPDEFLEILRVPFGEAMDWVRNGKICETKTVIGLFWLEKYWIRAGRALHYQFNVN